MTDVGRSSGADNDEQGHGFGPAPVFLAGISTILGAVLFLRFGYAVAHAGLAGSLAIVALGHLVTIPTALALAEIATNRRVEGGGEYFIISRSFGPTIGGAIGMALYLSQAISVAFYMIAFAESLRPIGGRIEAFTGLAFDPRIVSLPATVLLGSLVVVRGASLGVKALWAVTAILAVSLAAFFAGTPPADIAANGVGLFQTVDSPDPFMLVFAIVFPAFTGMTAGVGLSGDLANPRRSIPLGVISATLVGMVIYVFVLFKLAVSVTPDALGADPLVMAQVALWGPIIPIGLACATVSSAIGSILVAPRTLQALAGDAIVPGKRLAAVLAHGVGTKNEPRAATLVTGVVALVTVSLGSVDFVARIISMFFMVTYGALCGISVLEHFAGRPSYRPTFRSRWYVSLLGAVTCLFLMFQMDPLYALASIVAMVGLYQLVRASRGGPGDLAAIFQAVMSQASRYTNVRLQRTAKRFRSDWRPSVITVSAHGLERSAPVALLNWICYRYGFATWLQYISGSLDQDMYKESQRVQARLIASIRETASSLYVKTIVSPSLRTALAQSVQIPGVSGIDNNTLMLEFSIHDEPEVVEQVIEGVHMAGVVRMNSLVLRHGSHFFGQRARIHVWLTQHDYRNAPFMILLAYILLGHPEWLNAELSIFAAVPEEEASQRREELDEMIDSGRLPVNRTNLRVLATTAASDFDELVAARSATADLVIMGLTDERLEDKGSELLLRHAGLKDVLFASARQDILIE